MRETPPPITINEGLSTLTAEASVWPINLPDLRITIRAQWSPRLAASPTSFMLSSPLSCRIAMRVEDSPSLAHLSACNTIAGAAAIASRQPTLPQEQIGPEGSTQI